MGVSDVRDIAFCKGEAPMLPDDGGATEVRRGEVQAALMSMQPRNLPTNCYVSGQGEHERGDKARIEGRRASWQFHCQTRSLS
jgi:hypothetical protein